MELIITEPIFRCIRCRIQENGIWVEDVNNTDILQSPFGGGKYFLHHSSFKDIEWDPDYALGDIGDNYRHIIYKYTDPDLEVILVGGAEAEFLQRCIAAQTALFAPVGIALNHTKE